VILPLVPSGVCVTRSPRIGQCLTASALPRERRSIVLGLPLGRVAASLRQAGRKTAARAYDAMIAAIAVANELPVYTCNPDDFADLQTST
jgi:predicted nucleic acid-binding protein